jgi:hypothetical protein
MKKKDYVKSERVYRETLVKIFIQEHKTSPLLFSTRMPPIKYLISEIIYANLVVIVLCQYDAVNILQILFTFHPLHKLKWAFQFIPSKSQFEQQTH